MGICRERFDATCCLVTVLLCYLLFQPAHTSAVANCQHEVREALLAISGALRSSRDQLERHEGREKQLGDTLRRALSSVDKRVALLQRTTEEKHKELERFLVQAEERERIQLQKAMQNMESLGSMLEARLSIIEGLVQPNSNGQGDGAPTETTCVKLMEPKIELLQQKLGSLEEMVQNGATELNKSNENTNKFLEGLNLNLDKSSDILEHLINTENNKNKEMNSAVGHPSTSEELSQIMTSVSNTLNSLNAQSLETRQDAVRSIGRVMTALEQLREEMRTMNNGQSDLLVQKLNEAQNITVTAIEQASQEFEAKGDGGDTCQISEELTAVRDEFKTLSDLTETTKTELQMEVRNVGNRVTAEANGARDAVLKKVDDAIGALSPGPVLKILTDMEHVMLQAADGVMDVGRRVEHGNLRIISELGEEMRSTSSSVETSISSRLDNLAASVLVNQTGAMQTLSQKVESEISQVWRQIGIMYQQLTQSVGMLDKLQVQTENYVNGSLKSMGSVEGRVGQIGEKVGEVEGNLNFLLGRLSLVSTEFNLVKAGLAEALDDVRRNMATVNNNMRDVPKGTEYDHVNQVSPHEDTQ